MTAKSSREPALKHFRVFRYWEEVYVVDVLAPNKAAAVDRAECIDLEFCRVGNGRLSYESAEEIDADEFSPPDLPAGSWTASA